MIQKCINRHNFKSYLEIGLGNGANYNKVNCKHKTGVDVELPFDAPNFFKGTSDEFFDRNKSSFDFIFIDGLHHEEQVIKDIENALECVSKGGIILVHDCNPPSKEAQIVPREQKVWTGDVWKAWLKLRERTDIHQVCVEDDYGCGFILEGTQKSFRPVSKKTYDNLRKNRRSWLNLVSWQDFEDSYL